MIVFFSKKTRQWSALKEPPFFSRCKNWLYLMFCWVLLNQKGVQSQAALAFVRQSRRTCSSACQPHVMQHRGPQRGFKETTPFIPFWGWFSFFHPPSTGFIPVTCEFILPPPPASVTMFFFSPYPFSSPTPSLPTRSLKPALFWESLCMEGRGDMSCQPLGSQEEVCLQLVGSRTCSREKFNQTIVGGGGSV